MGINDGDDPFSVSPDEMLRWLQREIADIKKSAELRVAEATTFVEAFGRGDMKQNELNGKIHEYSARWGEALPGVGRSEGLTDKQILTTIDKTRVWQGIVAPDELKRRKPSSKHSRG